MNQANGIIWVASEKGRKLHFWELQLNNNNILLANRPGEVSALFDYCTIKEYETGEKIDLGELLAIVITPELFKIALDRMPGEIITFHRADGREYTEKI